MTEVQQTIEVTRPVPESFQAFTQDMDRWWPRSGHHLGSSGLKEAVLTTQAGGRWFEIDEDGSEVEWGRVLVWDQPGRLVLAWQIDATWHFNPEAVSEVEVRFIPTATGTRVELSQEHVERLGGDSEQLAAGLGQGWRNLLQSFAQYANGSPG